MASEKAMDVAETAIDAIEETIETIERVRPGHINLNGTTKKQQITIIVGLLSIGALSGGGLTYILLKKRLEKALEMKYEDISAREIEAAKEYYRSLKKVDTNGTTKTPEDILMELHGEIVVEDVPVEIKAVMKSYSGSETDGEDNPDEPESYFEEDAFEVEPPVVQTVVKKNIFDQAEKAKDEISEGWDYEVELRKRDENPDQPYIISEEEFLENENEYDQVSLTYFEGDDTLVDDRESPIPDSDATVGDDNLTQFGHGTKDKNMVYVRNDRLNLDFEVARHDGKYQVEVLGLDDPDSLQHSHNPRRFRGYDD